jgi:hypothetical protein
LERGVTVIAEVIVVLKLLAAVKARMFPVPVAGNPIDVFEFVQLKTVPNKGDPPKIIGPVV